MSVAVQAIHLSRLPKAQRTIFPLLGWSREAFVLYGGTACALHLGHRASVDFDLFSADGLDEAGKRRIVEEMESGGAVRITQDEESTLQVEVATGDSAVLISFFGGIGFPRLAPPVAAPVGPRIASRLDLAGLKLAMVYARHEENDAADLAALLDAGVSLDEAAGAMLQHYGEEDPIRTAVTAMSWLDGRSPSPQNALTEARRLTLRRAVAAWGNRIPKLPVDHPSLSAPGYDPAALA